ncbi:isochorismate synthase DhbC [Rhodoferax ferrireducens]|uniref:isochorismate synthase DhbC n=1 Tax=Rhodoferax ferrireducens TaxID=192843 RepID=UPI000E0D863C|nr:isochorismate synthase DhbC [Rhodoferax ferrireducens]
MNDVFRGVVDARAENLLSGYRSENPFFFATPEHTMRAQGHYATVPQAKNLAALSQAVDAELKKARCQGHPNPIVVGAIPFDARQAASLFIPQQVLRAGPLTSRADLVSARTDAFTITPEPAPQIYADGVAEAVRQIKDNMLSKVVLARALDLTAAEAIDVPYLLERLARRNRFGYTFAVNLAGAEQGALVGASPELLLSRRGTQVRSNPLAGSAARAKNQLEDAHRSQALLRSAKDLHEHKVVADAVAKGLRPYCRTLDVPANPSLINTEAMWHLSSDIRGELAHPAASSLLLAASLHPTPAVCGFPSEKAFDLISQIEPFDRGFYAGMVGWCDSEGNGEWVVTLRCAQVHGNSMRLFAGAGVVAESEPASELAETAAKFRTMLNALGLAQEGAL